MGMPITSSPPQNTASNNAPKVTASGNAVNGVKKAIDSMSTEDASKEDSSLEEVGKDQAGVKPKQLVTTTEAQQQQRIKAATELPIKPKQAQIEGAGLTPNILPKGTPANDPKTTDFPGATLPTETKPTTTGEAVSHTQATQGNTAMQSAHTMPTGKAAQAEFANDTETVAQRNGLAAPSAKQAPAATDGSVQGGQGLGYGSSGMPGGAVVNNGVQQSIGQQINIQGSPVIEQPQQIQQQLPPPQQGQPTVEGGGPVNLDY